MPKFEGFPKDFYDFFRELKAHNERSWFEDNKQRYRDSVQAPMSAFIEAMAPELKKISKHFVADPRPNGGSMFRIHRDVRFAKDKRPYKEHAACQFRHVTAGDAHAPGFYMHFAPGEVRFGGGLWMPASDALAQIRGAIAAKPAQWSKVKNDKTFRKTFGEIRGEGLSRPPRGFDPAHPHIEDIKRKSFFAMKEAGTKLTQHPKLIGEVSNTFKAASPLLKFICNALAVPY
ncbi:MAG TPA: DUF2461 domain-containing protein [Rhizomicrobium sp.]|nr:DUF2461 domain-containing protein [Rhizomicrobium sp.]